MSKKILLFLIGIVFLLTPFEVLAQKCEEKLDCYKKYEECKEDGKESAEKKAELEYQRCVNSKLLTFDKHTDYSKYCDPKSYNKAKCDEFLKQATEKAEKECLEEYDPNKEKFAREWDYTCQGIFSTCKEMEKEQCKKPTADKFPKTLNVTISRTCYWETNHSNIPTINSDSYNIQGVVELKERKDYFIRYHSKNLNATYQYKSIGIMKNPDDKCYGKIVHKVTGEGSASVELGLDIYIGESAKFVEGIRKGMIPTPKDLEQSGSKGTYDFIGGFAGSLLHQYADEQTGCKLVTMDTPPLPGFFVVGNQPLFSTQMFGKLKASEVGECEGEGYFVWNFSGGLGPMVRISEKYEIPVRLINFPQDEERIVFDVKNNNTDNNPTKKEFMKKQRK